MDIKSAARELALRYDSFYLYSEEAVDRQISRLLGSFEGVDFFYSFKTNPAKNLVSSILSHGLGADAASLGEVRLARQLGLSADNIHYSAPGKRDADIQAAMGVSTIIADSIWEIRQIQKLAGAQGKRVDIGVRLNPDFTFSSDRGTPSKFGIDEERALDFLNGGESLPNVNITGIHIHVKSQELDAAVLARYYENVSRLARRFQNALGGRLKFINMGSGMGIPYSTQDAPLDTVALGRRVSELAAELKKELGGVRVIIETGRFLVGQSGYYAARVVDRKESRGKTYIILNGTLNGFIRPCLEQLVARYAPKGPIAGCEPLFTGRDSFQFIALTDETETETVTLAGNLCTAADVFAQDIVLPKLKPGDMVLTSNAGGYAAVLTPMQFSSQEPTAQLLLRRDGSICDACS